MNFKRITRHLLMTRWQINRIFSKNTLLEIEHLIKASEAVHAGEIRFVVEGALECEPLFQQQTSQERAIDIFSQLRVWDTEHNNGILLYLLLADHAVEIIADRGIHAKVGVEQWQSICCNMESDFKQANFKGGVITGIDAMTQLLTKCFPATVSGSSKNELPDAPMML